MERVIEFAHNLISTRLKKDDISVDMTLGNGNDTLFLCRLSKFVYSFDIQSQALENSKDLLNKNGVTNYQLILNSHEFVKDYINQKVKCFIFNLGYLPKGDKSITTKHESTIKALNNCLDLLDVKGIIVFVVYPGHEEGKIEANILQEYVSTFNQKQFDVITYQFLNQINNPPYVIAIERKI